MSNNFEANIAELFQSYQNSKQEDIRFFVEKVHSNSVAAEKASNRRLFSIFFSWFVTWAIGTELISEAALGSFKFQSMKSLLLIVPPLMGILYYLLTTSRLALAKLDTIIKCYCKNTFADYRHQNVFRLMLSPDFSTIEDYVLFTTHRKPARFFAIGSMFVFYFLIWFLPIAAFTHASYLLSISKIWHWATSSLSIFIGLLFWLRSIVLWIFHWQE